MKLDQISKALDVAQEFGLDSTDLLILRDITDKQARGEEATITRFSSAQFASFGTIHTRIKRMVAKRLLVKRIKEKNERVKILEAGPELQTLIDKLTNI